MASSEKEPLLSSESESDRRYSVGVPSTVIEPPNEYRSRWRSIRVMYLTMFLSSVGFSICMSSIWPYLQKLDPSTTTSFLGWVVAAYSLGQLVASPFFGKWANFRNNNREPLIVSMAINVCANILYCYIQDIESHRGYYLILARGLIGFGAGNVAIVRAYTSGATTLKERTACMANMSAFQAVGFILGPAIQTALTPFGYPGPVEVPEIHLNMYTMPGFLSAIVGVVNILLLIFVFKEHRVHDDDDDTGPLIGGIQATDEHEADNPDILAVVASNLIFFMVLFVFSVFETILTPLTMDMYDWDEAQATLYIGIILAVSGVLSIVVFIGVKILAKMVNERLILIGGFVFVLAGFVTFLPWGDNFPDIEISPLSNSSKHNASISEPVFQQSLSILPEKNFTLSLKSSLNSTSSSSDFTLNSLKSFISTELLKNFTASSDVLKNFTVSIESLKNFTASTESLKNFTSSTTETYMNSTTTTVLNSTTTETYMNSTTTAVSNSTTPEPVTRIPVGCPAFYSWCYTTPKILFFQFLIGCVCIAIGYPVCNVMTYTLYSKILGPKPQGTMMGWLTASGSLARTLGPVFVSQIYEQYGPRWTFLSIGVSIVVTLIAIGAVYKKLIPYRHNRKLLHSINNM